MKKQEAVRVGWKGPLRKIRGPRLDYPGPGSWILAEAGLEASLPAFPAVSTGLSGHCQLSPPATEAGP